MTLFTKWKKKPKRCSYFDDALLFYTKIFPIHNEGNNYFMQSYKSAFFWHDPLIYWWSLDLSMNSLKIFQNYSNEIVLFLTFRKSTISRTAKQILTNGPLVFFLLKLFWMAQVRAKEIWRSLYRFKLCETCLETCLLFPWNEDNFKSSKTILKVLCNEKVSTYNEGVDRN